MSVATPIAKRITVSGRVQGLGVRPAVARWARALDLAGWVANTNQGIEIVVEGAAELVHQFVLDLKNHLPHGAAVEQQFCQPTSSPQCQTFEIRNTAVAGPLRARVPQDLVACQQCVDEALSQSDRRSAYPFVSCTACGPRLSIIEAMPYERERTSMDPFSMCPLCRREYDSPLDRRFHAQTNACPDCGPRIWCRDASGRMIADGSKSLCLAADALLRGKIVALQGLGGYQLLVDATSEEAVGRLRTCKERFGKPFPVMVSTLEDVRRLACCNEVELEALKSAAGPIVVLRKKEGCEVAQAVSPRLDTLGLILPTTPLHALLLRTCQRPLVVTSGNRDGEPLEFEHEGAQQSLTRFAELLVEHDRTILHPVDDSVVRVIAGRVASLRLARGYAPLSLEIKTTTPQLAVGGNQKVAVALSNGEQAVLGSHIGDLDSVSGRLRWEAQIHRWLKIYGTNPEHFVGDMHPDYISAQWAREQPKRFFSVQHHHAHIAAGMVEHRWLDRSVLGVAFDGTGYGTDGTIWGGEFLTATATDFQRVGHLLPLALPGGERAILEPWRVAVSLVQRAMGEYQAASLVFQRGKPSELLPWIGNPRLSPVTTSAGRLFDGLAALLLGVERSQFEGEGPMLLEAVCDRSCTQSYCMPVCDSGLLVLDWRPAIANVVEDLRSGVAAGEISMRFHRGLAFGIFEIARRFRQCPVVLSGGCFQNRLLVELLAELFEGTGQLLGTPGLIPVNDGGLAAGQLAVSSASLFSAAR